MTTVLRDRPAVPLDDATRRLGPVGIAAYSYSADGRSPWLASEIGRVPVEIFDTADGAPLERNSQPGA